MRTRVGYSGGTLELPTYRKIGDHSESIQIDFDPEHISYRQLVQEFWRGHDPTTRSWSRQYMSAIFYHNETQRELAFETRALEEKKRNKKIQTEILPLSNFYLAEDYHQKYQLRGQRDLMREFKAMYPREVDFVNSTAAARVNGYLGGYGSSEEIKATVEKLGLSNAGREQVAATAKRWKN